MSGSNWGNVFKALRQLNTPAARWWIIAIFAVAVAGVVILLGSAKQAEYERATEYQTSEYHQHSYGPALQSCFGKPLADQPNCIADAKRAERENARHESDLEAQRITALWTFIMGCAAVTGMVLSGIGVGLVWITFQETKGSNSLFKSKERAIITPSAKILVSWQTMTVTISAVNIGPTSALNVNCRHAVSNDTPNLANLANGQFAHTVEGGKETNLLAIPVDEATAKGKFIYGLIIYDTVFESGRVTPFCYVLGQMPKQPGLNRQGLSPIPCVPPSWPLAN